MHMSFGAMEMDARVGRDSTLLKAHALIDWEGSASNCLGSASAKPAGPVDKSPLIH